MQTVINSILNILSENNISIYSLSKSSGINQSTLHKILHSERSMKSKYFYTIIDNLPISLNDKSILTDRYQKLTLGREKYNAQSCILNMLKNFSNDSFSILSNRLIPPTVYPSSTTDTAIYKGSSVATVVSMALIEEMGCPSPKAYIYVPGSSPKISSYIDSTIKLYDTDMHINFMIDFVGSSSPAKTNYNLRILQNIMPLALSSSADYNFYYTYVEAVTDSSYMTPYPYFIVTSDRVIWINHDFDEILVINDYAVTKNMITYCEGKLTKYKRFLEVSSDVQSIVGTLVNNQDKTSEHYCIEYEPCFSLYFTNEMIDSVVPEGVQGREQLVQMLYTRLSQLKQIKSSIQIFNKNSLAEFARTGRIAEFPTEFSRPCTKEERQFILNSLIASAKSDKHIIRALNPINLQISDCLSLIIQGEGCLQFSVWNDKKMPLKYLTIIESSLCKCFFDFINTLPETNLVYSKAETIAFIKEAIELTETADDNEV